MRESVRDGVSPGAFLNAIVAHCACGIEPFLEIAALENIAPLLRLMGPHAGQTIGLQFEHDAQFVSFGGAGAGLKFGHLLKNAQLGLHVMADFMGNDVGPGEIPGGAEPVVQFVEARSR